MNSLYSLCAITTGMIIDIVVVIVALIFMIGGAKRGFINCFFGFISTLVALILAISLAKVAVTATGGLFGLQSLLEERFIASFSTLSGFDIDVSGENLETLLASKDLPAILITLAIKNNGGALAAGTTLGMVVGESVAWVATVLISGIGLFILIKLLVCILRKLFNSISSSIALVGFLNKFLGLLVGVIEALLLVSLVISIATLIPSQGVMDFFNSSIIMKAIYDYNPIVVIISWFL